MQGQANQYCPWVLNGEKWEPKRNMENVHQLNFLLEQPSQRLRNSQRPVCAVSFPHQPMFQPPVLNPGSDMLEQDPEEVKLG